MKVIVNQQVMTRPKILKAIKPGFQNFGKDVEINTRGQLVSQDAKAKELKKTFGLENAFKDMGYLNIVQNAKVKGIEKGLGLEKEGLNIEKDSGLKNMNIFKDIKSQNIGQKSKLATNQDRGVRTNSNPVTSAYKAAQNGYASQEAGVDKLA